jgi:hypothetical protein
MLKTRLSLCAQVIDWCFCALVFSCPVGNAFFALFRKAGVIVKRCRLFGASYYIKLSVLYRQSQFTAYFCVFRYFKNA